MTVRAKANARNRLHRQEGQITAMLVIFALCLLLAISAVTDLSASYLRRQAATSLADGAALAATDGAASAAVYGDDDAFVQLDTTAAEAAVETYLDVTGAYRDFPGLHIEVVVAGHVVNVNLSMPYRLPIAVPGAQSTTTIHASASAEMPIY